MAEERLTKDQKREQAREAARLERERRLKAQSRNRILIRAGATVGIVAVLAAVGWGVWLGTRPAGPGPANMAADGILFTANSDKTDITAVETNGVPDGGTPTATDPADYDVPMHIVTYIDFGCPYCNQFETTNSEQIRGLVAQGYATLEVHPISILDKSFQGSRYPSRAANAAACVAAYDPEDFLDVSDAFYAQQPAEGTTGLDNAAILDLLKGAGADSAQITSCVNDESFKGWVAASSARATAGPLPNTKVEKVAGTPTVLVNGVQYQGSLSDANAFAAFLAQNADFSGSDSGDGPTPTPTPTP